MKAILIPTIALIVTIGVTMLLTRLITTKRRREGKLTRKGRIIIFFVLLILLYTSSGFVYFSIYSHAAEQAMVYMNGSDTVKVTEIDTGYLFDGPGSKDAFIFYPGAKVDEKAYAELMTKIADQGVDCFLVAMPFHMAFMGKTKADDIIDEYAEKGYEHWYIGGHSLGGAMAGIYASERGDKLDGLVMLASYSTGKLDPGMKVMTVLATNDHIINMQDYEDNKKNLPESAQEITIQGGNHSQFGDYGDQRGDGQATISRDEQMEEVSEAVVRMISPQFELPSDVQDE